jgi:2-hydroxychromene-2-carboxylate isomerase
MRSSQLEFWFEFASTYSYPASARVSALARSHNIEIVWRPFMLGPLLHAHQGMTDSPFNVVPVKGTYMWRDMERVCQSHGLALQRPSKFPRGSILGSRLALVGQRAGWADKFVPAVYAANFASDSDIADQAVLERILAEIGVDPEPALLEAVSDPVKAELKANTDEALNRGIFGSPSFFTSDGELFWGNDRLDQALDWAMTITRQGNA